MICGECNSAYLSKPEDRSFADGLIGLCEQCGTEPKYNLLALSFGTGATLAIISFEFVFFVTLLSSWQSLLIIVGIVVATYLATQAVVSKGKLVVYKNTKARNAQVLIQRVIGGLSGFGLSWFLAIKGLV